MFIFSKKFGLVVSFAIVLSLLIGLGPRAVQTRRHARLNDFFREFYLKKSATCEAVAQDCESYDDETLNEVARHNRSMAAAYAKRADYHSQLSRRYWSALIRPWIILPPDPPPPVSPADAGP